MFFRKFLLSAIMLFTLVHFIACVVEHLETDESPLTTINSSTGRKKPPRSSSVKTNQQMKDLEYSDDLEVSEINQATSNIGSEVNKPDAKGSYYKRVKRSESKTNELESNNDDKRKNKPKSYQRQTSKRSSKSLPEIDEVEYPKDEHNFSETSQSFLESPPSEPTSSPVKNMDKIDSLQSGTDGLKRISRKAKLDTETSDTDLPILSNEPINIENNSNKDVEIPQFMESLPENEEEDMLEAQDVFLPPFYKHHKSNDDMIISSLVYSNTFSGLPGSILNFDDSPSDEGLDTLDKSDPITEEKNTQELDQSSEEPVILSILKVVIKSLRDLFSAVKDIIQRSHIQ